jgi:hypothetical protein
LLTIACIHQARTLAIKQLSALELSAIEKVQHAREYHVSAWFKEGVAVIANDLDEYDMEELGKTLGWKTTSLIFSLRDKARQKEPSTAEEHELALGHSGWQCPYCMQPNIRVTKSESISLLASCMSCQRTLLCITDAQSTAAGSQPSATVRVAITQDRISQVFEEEINALDAYVSL